MNRRPAAGDPADPAPLIGFPLAFGAAAATALALIFLLAVALWS